MPKLDVIAGVDVGSAQICCVAAKRSEKNGEFEIVGGSRAPCRGVKGGVVINLQDTSHAVQKAIEQLEEQTGSTIRQIYLGIRGSHIDSANQRGAISISRTDKEITPEDIAGATENAKTIRLSPDREILHTIAQTFSLDHQRGVPNPVGMEGNFLEVDVHILIASSAHLNNIYKSIAQAGFEVLEPIYGLLAVGDIVVTQEEKELGCLLLDIGGLTTGVAIYTEGSVRYTKELQIGADFITRDISHALRTSLSTAQSIKEKYGCAMSSLLSEDEQFDYASVDGRTIRQSSKKQLVDIIQPRLDQIFVAIEQDLKQSGLYDAIMAGGVIVTGGGSKLSGMIQAAEQALGTQARIGLPQDIAGKEDIISDPIYATAVGLFRSELAKGQTRPASRPLKSGGPSIFKKLRDWAEETF